MKYKFSILENVSIIINWCGQLTMITQKDFIMTKMNFLPIASSNILEEIKAISQNVFKFNTWHMLMFKQNF
jgi:hypothetical protein